MYTLSDIDKKNIIGKGISGKIYQTHDNLFVFKEYDLESEQQSCYVYESVVETTVMETMKQFSGTNIQKIENEIFEVGTNGYFMKLYPMDLSERIKKPLSLDLAKRILYQLLEALYSCHEMNIVHADVKPNNILIDVEDNAVLADWGHSITIGNKYSQTYGINQTLFYRAPEILLKAPRYGTKIDIWSLGLVYLEMMSKKPFIYSKNEKEQLNKIIKIFGCPTENNWPGVTNFEGYKNISVKYCNNTLIKLSDDDEANDLLLKMLKLNPNERYSAIEALNHSFFDDIRPNNFQKNYPLFYTQYLNDIYPYRNNYPNRSKYIRYLHKICQVYSLDLSVFFCSTEILDYFVYMNKETNDLDINLVAISSAYLSSIFLRYKNFIISDIIYLTDNKYSGDEICSMSYQIHKSLNYNMYIPSFMIYINLFVKALESAGFLNINKSDICELILFIVTSSSLIYLNHDKIDICIAVVSYIYKINRLGQIKKFLNFLGIEDFNIQKVNEILKLLKIIKK